MCTRRACLSCANAAAPDRMIRRSERVNWARHWDVGRAMGGAKTTRNRQERSERERERKQAIAGLKQLVSDVRSCATVAFVKKGSFAFDRSASA